jgi:hypothetical protein
MEGVLFTCPQRSLVTTPKLKPESDCLPNTYRFLRCKLVLTHFSLRETTYGTLYYVVHPASKSAIAEIELRFTVGNLRTKPSTAPQQIDYFTLSACHSSFDPPPIVQMSPSDRRELRTIERGRYEGGKGSRNCRIEITVDRCLEDLWNLLLLENRGTGL